MDFHNMKRKDLRALCKKHNIPANATNQEMADRLVSLLKVEERPRTRRASSLKDSGEISPVDDYRAARRPFKKVRFSVVVENDEVVKLEKTPNGRSPVDMKRRSRRSGIKPDLKTFDPVTEKEVSPHEERSEISVRTTRSRAGKSLEGNVTLVQWCPVKSRKVERRVNSECNELKNGKPPPCANDSKAVRGKPKKASFNTEIENIETVDLQKSPDGTNPQEMKKARKRSVIKPAVNKPALITETTEHHESEVTVRTTRSCAGGVTLIQLPTLERKIMERKMNPEHNELKNDESLPYYANDSKAVRGKHKKVRFNTQVENSETVDMQKSPDRTSPEEVKKGCRRSPVIKPDLKKLDPITETTEPHEEMSEVIVRTTRSRAGKSIAGGVNLAQLPTLDRRIIKRRMNPECNEVKNDKPAPVMNLSAATEEIRGSPRRSLRRREVLQHGVEGNCDKVDISLEKPTTSRKKGVERDEIILQAEVSEITVTDKSDELSKPETVLKQPKRKALKVEALPVSGTLETNKMYRRSTRFRVQMVDEGSAVQTGIGIGFQRDYPRRSCRNTSKHESCTPSDMTTEDVVVCHEEKDVQNLFPRRSKHHISKRKNLAPNGRKGTHEALGKNNTEKQSRQIIFGVEASHSDAGSGFQARREKRVLDGPLRRSKRNASKSESTASSHESIAKDENTGRDEPLKKLKGSEEVIGEAFVSQRVNQLDLLPRKSKQNLTKYVLDPPINAIDAVAAVGNNGRRRHRRDLILVQESPLTKGVSPVTKATIKNASVHEQSPIVEAGLPPLNVAGGSGLPVSSCIQGVTEEKNNDIMESGSGSHAEKLNGTIVVCSTTDLKEDAKLMEVNLLEAGVSDSAKLKSDSRNHEKHDLLFESLFMEKERVQTEKERMEPLEVQESGKSDLDFGSQNIQSDFDYAELVEPVDLIDDAKEDFLNDSPSVTNGLSPAHQSDLALNVSVEEEMETAKKLSQDEQKKTGDDNLLEHEDEKAPNMLQNISEAHQLNVNVKEKSPEVQCFEFNHSRVGMVVLEPTIALKDQEGNSPAAQLTVQAKQSKSWNVTDHENVVSGTMFKGDSLVDNLGSESFSQVKAQEAEKVKNTGHEEASPGMESGKGDDKVASGKFSDHSVHREVMEVHGDVYVLSNESFLKVSDFGEERVNVIANMEEYSGCKDKNVALKEGANVEYLSPLVLRELVDYKEEEFADVGWYTVLDQVEKPGDNENPVRNAAELNYSVKSVIDVALNVFNGCEEEKVNEETTKRDSKSNLQDFDILDNNEENVQSLLNSASPDNGDCPGYKKKGLAHRDHTAEYIGESEFHMLKASAESVERNQYCEDSMHTANSGSLLQVSLLSDAVADHKIGTAEDVAVVTTAERNTGLENVKNDVIGLEKLVLLKNCNEPKNHKLEFTNLTEFGAPVDAGRSKEAPELLPTDTEANDLSTENIAEKSEIQGLEVSYSSPGV